MRNNQRGAATAELVVALPLVISLSLLGVNFLGSVIERERLRFIAEGVVQAVMRDESAVDIAREVHRTLPGAQYQVLRNISDGTLQVTVTYKSASASVSGFQ